MQLSEKEYHVIQTEDKKGKVEEDSKAHSEVKLV